MASRTATARRPRSSATIRAPRVQWDRLARTAMLGVMTALAYLYLGAGLRLFSTWREGRRDSGQVRALEAQNRALRHQHALLSGAGAVQTQARRLGMVRAGEQDYVVSGLPNN